MATETRGRRPTYSNPEDMRREVINYFDFCAKNKPPILPDYPGMVIFLKFRSKQSLERYADPATHLKRCGGDEEAAKKLADAYAEILEEAKLRRESYLARIMSSDNKRAQGCLNLLKQPENGGYTDRPPESNEKTLNIRVIGVGGWDAFR